MAFAAGQSPIRCPEAEGSGLLDNTKARASSFSGRVRGIVSCCADEGSRATLRRRRGFDRPRHFSSRDQYTYFGLLSRHMDNASTNLNCNFIILTGGTHELGRGGMKT